MPICNLPHVGEHGRHLFPMGGGGRLFFVSHKHESLGQDLLHGRHHARELASLQALHLEQVRPQPRGLHDSDPRTGEVVHPPSRLGASRELQLRPVRLLDVLVYSYRLLLEGFLARTKGAPANRRGASMGCAFCLQKARRLEPGSHSILQYA